MDERVVPTLVVLVDPAVFWPQLAAELYDAGEFLWAATAPSGEDLLAELTRRHGHGETLARLHPHGFRLDWRWPAVAASA